MNDLLHVPLTRRKLLKGGVAAAACCSLPAVCFLPAGAEGVAQKSAGGLQAHMIWSAQSPPVTVTPNGQSAYTRLLSEPERVSETFDRHSVFVKQFELAQVPAHASMQIFAYTRYRLYVNGVYQGRGPSRFQVQWPEYDTREIGAALRPGKNEVVVLVHRDAPTGRSMGHVPGFAAKINFGSGRTVPAIVTDASWLSRPDQSFGERKEAWSSIEENIDARRGVDFSMPAMEAPEWQASVAVEGPAFVPVWPRATPLQGETPRGWSVAAEPNPKLLHAGDESTFELPEIMQGYHLLRMDAEVGSTIEVDYVLPDGEHNGASRYIARAGEQEWMGGDTFAMKRMVVRVTAGQVKLLDARAFEVRYPFERVGSFECSDPFLNQLWSICARSLEVLSEDSYVDCADRERVEWTDNSPPAFDCTRVMMRGPKADGVEYWGDNRLLQSLLRRISLTQQPDGQLKAHSCSERFDIHAIMEDRSCDWVVLLRQYYESSGDKRFVAAMWPALTRLMQWFLERRTDRGLVLAREWEVWDNPLRYEVCEGAGTNALVYRALEDAAYLGAAIGKRRESAAYADDARRLHADVNTLLWNSGQSSYDGALFGPGSKQNPQMGSTHHMQPVVDGRYPPTATAALFALYCGIVPEERVEAVRTWLLAHEDEIESPMSYYYLFDALYAMQTPEHDEEALNKMRTGWKVQVDSPWQTTWEELTNGGGSKVHVYGMSPGYFLTAYVLGARRVGPVADRTIVLEPRCGDLTRAAGTAVTEFGPVRMQWAKGAQGISSLDCSIPAGVKAKLRLYTSGESRDLLLNGKQVATRVDGRFLELDLPTGQSSVRSVAQG